MLDDWQCWLECQWIQHCMAINVGYVLRDLYYYATASE